jgi:hypothetical protein
MSLYLLNHFYTPIPRCLSGTGDCNTPVAFSHSQRSNSKLIPVSNTCLLLIGPLQTTPSLQLDIFPVPPYLDMGLESGPRNS